MGNCALVGAIDKHQPISTYTITATMGHGEKPKDQLDGFSVILHGEPHEETVNLHADVLDIKSLKWQTTAELKLSSVSRITVTRNTESSYQWYIDTVTVQKKGDKNCKTFPIHQWISKIHHYSTRDGTCLPNDEPDPNSRKQQLENARREYQLEHDNGLPMKVKSLPPNEDFSLCYEICDIGVPIAKLMTESAVINITIEQPWRSLDDFNKLFQEPFDKPKALEHWKTDFHFGQQRMNHCNSSVIRLCKHIPKEMKFTAEMLEPFLENCTLDKVMDENRLFICDLKIVKNLLPVCPVVILFQNASKELVPIAIQLNQYVENDTVFLPTSGNKYTWMLAKMWYNLADAAVHQSVVHLGFTHLIMEGFCVVTHRQLSVYHPVLQLLAPHFKYLLAINRIGRKTLLGPNGWVQQTMKIGTKGAEELIRRKLVDWRLDIDGTVVADLKNRGLDNSAILPDFFYRDDAIKIYNTIKDYVESYLKLYYINPGSLENDNEIQNWGKDMVKSRLDNGLGIQGVPNDGNFTTLQQLIDTVTPIIFTCSATHAAVNFPQYDEYAYAPNYPAYMEGEPPKDTNPLTEEHVLMCLPDKNKALGIMIITKVLSNKATNSLGKFPVEYNHEQKAKDVVKRFQNSLNDVQSGILKRNKNLEKKKTDGKKSVPYPYRWLEPSRIPNSIAI